MYMKESIRCIELALEAVFLIFFVFSGAERLHCLTCLYGKWVRQCL